GRVTRFDFSRYAILRPRNGEAMPAGATATLAWRGSEPARVSRSVDGGVRWTMVAARAGGLEDNQLRVATPGAPANRGRWRLEPADSRWKGAVESPDFAIER